MFVNLMKSFSTISFLMTLKTRTLSEGFPTYMYIYICSFYYKAYKMFSAGCMGLKISLRENSRGSILELDPFAYSLCGHSSISKWDTK